MEEISVIVTSCGGKVIPGIVDCLRSAEGYQFDIVGVDMREGAVGQHFTDSFHTVPHGLDEDYTDRMLEIAEIEDTDVIVPLSDEEVRTLSAAQSKFRKEGVEILCSDADAVARASDKGEMLEFLDSRGVPVPGFRRPSSLSELDEAVRDLGYPDREVVLKPTTGRGGRGFWIISDEHNTQDLALERRCLQTLPYDQLRSMLADRPSLPPVVAMEYLAGTDYNVDVLVDHGDVIYSMPIERIEPDAGPVEVGRIVHSDAVDSMVANISNEFSFDLNVNIELAYPTTGDEGTPMVYEINPRVSGPIAMHRSAGVNLLVYGVLKCIGEMFPKDLDYKITTVSRCWQEIYE